MTRPSTRASKRKSSACEENPIEEQQQPLSSRTEEPQQKRIRGRSVPDEVNVEMDVLVKEEPRVEGEELTENDYHQLDPLVLRSETDLWCVCPLVGAGEVGCGDGCENRARRVECSECEVGAQQCTNRALQNLGSPPLTFSGGNLSAATNLEAGAVLGQFTGEVMTREAFQTRLEGEYAQQNYSLYVFPLTEELVVDATSKGSIIRFAGHSCSPNAEISVWKVSGLDCLAVTAKKEIQAGETISLDLSPAMKFLGTSKRCSCNAGNCKILLGSSATTRGPERCGACLQQVLEAGKLGKVLLHPELATPVCESCYERHQQQDWDQSGVCSWCCSGGEKSLLSCVSCPRAFCRKCLQQNLGPSYIKLAATGSWSCLVCNTEPLVTIRRSLWLEGEEERQRQPVKSGLSRTFSQPRAPASPAVRMAGRSIRSPAPAPRSPAAIRSPAASRGTPPPAPRGATPGLRGVRPGTPRQLMRLVRPARPGTPRVRMPPPAGPVRAPYPRMLGSNVSIERVARPPQPPPAQHKPATASIISQLQRYSGLSIQPVSQSTSSLESACSHLESLQRSIQAAAAQSRKVLKTDVPEAKKQIQEIVKLSKSKISEIESLL